MSDTHDDNEGPISAIYQTVVDVAVTEAAKAEREQCCKDVCKWCEKGSPFRGVGGYWLHPLYPDCLQPHTCLASAIRERAAREVDGAKPRAN